jgi:hypothetical protein
MPTGGTPAAAVSNRSVTVSWAQRTIGGSPVAGYVVRRYNGSGTVQTIGASCAGTIAALTCTETGVPAGSWRYTVQPRHNNWAGPESSMTSAVAVAAPTFTFSSSTEIVSLPSTLNGTLANYVTGETVTFRLDNATTGTVLSGTVVPSPIPSGGGAAVTVTIPAGTAAGTHTVYAIGSQGDVVGATVYVVATVTTSAWDLRDGSSGTLANSSAPHSFASDSLTLATTTWTTAFAGTRYMEFDMNAPLPSGQTVIGGTFNFRYAGIQNTDTVCFYFEVRRISTGAVLATHGSAGAPVGCVTGTTQTTTSTPIPSINTSVLANDVRIRVYGRSSGSRAMAIDMATVSGTAAGTAFTQYAKSYVDSASGTPAVAVPWTLATEEANAFQSAATNWLTTFSASRYLRLTFPAYVPATATVTGATLKHVFRPSSSANSACWYAEVYSGGLLIGIHGSSASPISCRTGTSYTTDTVPLPEVNTPAYANDLTVRAYFWVTGGNANRRTQHDLTQLTVNYAP